MNNVISAPSTGDLQGPPVAENNANGGRPQTSTSATFEGGENGSMKDGSTTNLLAGPVKGVSRWMPASPAAGPTRDANRDGLFRTLHTERPLPAPRTTMWRVPMASLSSGGGMARGALPQRMIRFRRRRGNVGGSPGSSGGSGLALGASSGSCLARARHELALRSIRPARGGHGEFASKVSFRAGSVLDQTTVLRAPRTGT